MILALLHLFLSCEKQPYIPKRVVGPLILVPTMLSLLPGYDPWNPLIGYDNYLITRRVILTLSPLVSFFVAICYIVFNLISVAKGVLKQMYRDLEWGRTIVRHYGIYTLIENQWSRLHVPQVQCLWPSRCICNTPFSGSPCLLVVSSAGTSSGHGCEQFQK